MKRYFASRPSHLSFIVLLVAGFAAFIAVEGESLAETNSRELDRLLDDMGVIKISQALPIEIELKDLNGRLVRLSDFRGKIVFLNFWTTWCFDCRIEMPNMEKLHQQFKNKEFEMVAVNLQEPVSQVEQFFKDYKLTFTALLDSDGEIGAHFRITSIPTSYILNRQGILIGKVMGPRKWDDKKSFALFEHLTNSSVATTSNLRH